MIEPNFEKYPELIENLKAANEGDKVVLEKAERADFANLETAEPRSKRIRKKDRAEIKERSDWVRNFEEKEETKNRLFEGQTGPG